MQMSDSPHKQCRHWEELARHCCRPPPASSSSTRPPAGNMGIDPSSPKLTFDDMMRYRSVGSFFMCPCMCACLVSASQSHALACPLSHTTPQPKRLHEHKEVVEELVATAARELKIENQLEVWNCVIWAGKRNVRLACICVSFAYAHTHKPNHIRVHQTRLSYAHGWAGCSLTTSRTRTPRWSSSSPCVSMWLKYVRVC